MNSRQVSVYRCFLKSEKVHEVLSTSQNALVSLTTLQKMSLFVFSVMCSANHIMLLNHRERQIVTSTLKKQREENPLNSLPEFSVDDFFGEGDWDFDSDNVPNSDNEEEGVSTEPISAAERALIANMSASEYAAYLSNRKETKRSPKRISKKGISLSKLRSQLEELSENALYDNGNKLNVVIPLIINLIDDGHRVLVFGRYLKMLCIIAECLRRRNVDCLHYNGKLNTQQREDTLHRFHTSEADVLLITVGAGGEGITITEADRIILIDPNWNPTVDDQAIDRAYVPCSQYVVDIELVKTRTCWCIVW